MAMEMESVPQDVAATEDLQESAAAAVETAKRARDADASDLVSPPENEDASKTKKARVAEDDNGDANDVGEENEEAQGEGDEDDGTLNEQEEGGVKEAVAVGPVKLGPKVFQTSVEMFDYFFKFVHLWPLHVDINKYEHLVLLDLLTKGAADAQQKIGSGVKCFQVRNHPMWKSRCYFLMRDDGTTDDFSYRKCIDRILPLPESMKAPAGKNVDDALKGHGKGHGGGHGRGRGRGKGNFGRGRGGKRRN